MPDESIFPSASNGNEASHPHVVALVILQDPPEPAQGAAVRGEAVTRYPARHRDMDTPFMHFAMMKFEVGPTIGSSFSIAGNPALFQRIFGITPICAPDGGWTLQQGNDELPLDTLPPPLRERIAAVVFERPVELHGHDE